MRGADSYNGSLFTTVKLEDFVPAHHPLRPIRTWINEALAKMDERFSAMYEVDIKGGRPSIAPEKLMRAMLLQVLYSIRSERQLVEQIQYDLLFRWFVGLAIDERTTRHVGYDISQRKRKCIEQCFGWGKLIGPIRQVMVQALDKVDQLLTLTMTAYNLTRLRTLTNPRPRCAQ
jgi:transposase